MYSQMGWASLPRWRKIFVALVVGVLPLRELWNWWLLFSRWELMSRVYARPPQWALAEVELYYSLIAWWGLKVGLRVLRQDAKATDSALSYLWWSLVAYIAVLFHGGLIFPLPPIRADLDAQYYQARDVGYVGNVVIHLVVFVVFYALFRRAKSKQAQAPT